MTNNTNLILLWCIIWHFKISVGRIETMKSDHINTISHNQMCIVAQASSLVYLRLVLIVFVVQDSILVFIIAN
jgi:hypothetical protein